MRERIRALESIARRLEPNLEARERLLSQVNGYAQQFLEALEAAPAFVETDDQGRGLYDSPLSEEGIGIDEALGLLAENVNTPGINPASARFLGYIPGGGLFHAALGDFLAAVTNRYAGLFFASPGAVRMENMLLDWMGSVVDYPVTRGGNLTSGGSIANLIGIVTARDACGITAEEVRRAVVYTTQQRHHSIDKALHVAGLGNCVVRKVPMDNYFRMQVSALEAAIRADQQAGLRPWLVIGAAGTTDTGAVDPLDHIAQVAHRYDLWYHVDGAYGAFFALCEMGKQKLQGIEQSHSVVMDPHKTLFLPYGTGAIIVRDRAKLFASNQQLADYLQDAEQPADTLSPADVSPELTKHFRGLRLWLPLKLAGIAPFRAALEEKLLLARYFHQRIQEIDGFEVGPVPDLSIAIYRYVPQRGDPNQFNARLVRALQKSGRVFVSSTTIDDTYVLRMAISSFRSHLDHVDEAIEVLEETARNLEQDH